MVCLFLVQWSAALAPLCRSQRPAHTGAATLTIRFRGRLQGLEPESTADPSAAGRLARRGRKDQIRPPPGPLRDPHRAAAFRWTQLSEGAMGLAPAIGADQARKQADKRQSTLRSNVTEDGNAEYRILCTNAAWEPRQACARPAPDLPGAAKGRTGRRAALRVPTQVAHYQSLTRSSSDRFRATSVPLPMHYRWLACSPRRIGSIGSLPCSSTLARFRRNTHSRELWRGG